MKKTINVTGKITEGEPATVRTDPHLVFGDCLRALGLGIATHNQTKHKQIVLQNGILVCRRWDTAKQGWKITRRISRNADYIAAYEFAAYLYHKTSVPSSLRKQFVELAGKLHTAPRAIHYVEVDTLEAFHKVTRELDVPGDMLLQTLSKSIEHSIT